MSSLGKWLIFPALPFIALLGSLVLLGQTSTPPTGHILVEVINGGGSGNYSTGEEVALSAEGPEGSQFLKWIQIEGDGIIDAPFATDATFTVGQEEAKIVAVFAKVRSWFAPDPDEECTTSILLPDPPEGDATRLEHRIKVTLNRGEADKPEYEEIWNLLDLRLEWEDPAHISYYPQETGGEEIANRSLLPKSAFEADPDSADTYEASLWFEGNLSATQIAELIESGDLGDVTIDLNLVINEEENEPCWTGRLVPVDIRVTKEGEVAAPEDGLVVKKVDFVRYRLSPGLPDAPLLLEDKIQWYWRILKWDGTYGDWTAYQDGRGHSFANFPENAGIYEVKATIKGQDFFLKRSKDDTHSAKEKDENDCFGVVDEHWQIEVRNATKNALGSKAYARAAKNAPFGRDTPKCNLFVAHKATAGGALVQWINQGKISKFPPTANQWAGTDPKHIPNWTLLPEKTFPQPGWIVARAAKKNGHTGFIDYDGAWIGAGTFDVNRKADLRNDISLRSGQAIYQPARFRKYTP